VQLSARLGSLHHIDWQVLRNLVYELFLLISVLLSCANSGKGVDDYLILPQSSKEHKGAKAAAPESEQSPPSKSELRKLKQGQLKNERRQNITQVGALMYERG
jgi:hypothetical protein